MKDRKLVEDLYQEMYEKLKNHKDYPHYDNYSIDYLAGIVRGIVLIIRRLAYLKEDTKTSKGRGKA